MDIETLKNNITIIKTIEKESKEKTDEISSLQDEIALNNSKIEWVKEDIRDIIHKEFPHALKVYMHDSCIEVKFEKMCAGINIQSAVDFGIKHDIKLNKLNIQACKDYLYLRINLMP